MSKKEYILNYTKERCERVYPEPNLKNKMAKLAQELGISKSETYVLGAKLMLEKHNR